MPITENTQVMRGLMSAIIGLEQVMRNTGGWIERNTQVMERVEQLMIDASQQEETAHAAAADYLEATGMSWCDQCECWMDNKHEHIREVEPVKPELCDCELRNRAWDPNTGRCRTCSLAYKAEV